MTNYRKCPFCDWERVKIRDADETMVNVSCSNPRCRKQSYVSAEVWHSEDHKVKDFLMEYRSLCDQFKMTVKDNGVQVNNGAFFKFTELE